MDHHFQHSRDFSQEELARSKQARLRWTMRITGHSVKQLAAKLGIKVSTITGRLYGKLEPLDVFYMEAMAAMGRPDGTIPDGQPTAERKRAKTNPHLFLATTANHIQALVDNRAVPQLRSAALYHPINHAEWCAVRYRVDRLRTLAADLLAVCDEAMEAVDANDPSKPAAEVQP